MQAPDCRWVTLLTGARPAGAAQAAWVGFFGSGNHMMKFLLEMASGLKTDGGLVVQANGMFHSLEPFRKDFCNHCILSCLKYSSFTFHMPISNSGTAKVNKRGYCNDLTICILKDGLMEPEDLYVLIYSLSNVDVSLF